MTISRPIRVATLHIVGQFYSKNRSVECPRSVLLIRPDHLGDLLFVGPAIRMARQELPAARLTLLVGPWSQAVAARYADLDEVLTCPFPGFERQPKKNLLAPYRLLFATAGRLRGRFDAAVVLRFDHWWGAWLAAAAGIPLRIGYDRPETRPFLTHALPYRPDRHEVEQNAALIAALCGCDAGRPGPLQFPIGEAARAWAADWLADHGVRGGRPLIAIHAGAGAAVKQWPPAAWAEVARQLSETFDAQILLTGSAAERPLAQAIMAGLAVPALDATGQTDLEQLAALLERCTAVLGSDSGPLHLAVAVGTPTVHLYGPASAVKFGPWGDPTRHIVLRSNWACAPCNRLDWPAAVLSQHACMSAIQVDDVLRATQALLSGAPHAEQLV